MRAQEKWFHPFLVLLTLLIAANTATAQSNDATSHKISGIVTEDGSRARDVVVFLCDQATGLPISSETRKPMAKQDQPIEVPKILTALTDEKGEFKFENLPAGEYRVVAQRWGGAFKGAFEVQSSVIQLFGSLDHIKVPGASYFELRPPGDGVMVFDQEVGNDETFFLLSTRPPAGDAILSFYALGTNYMSHAIVVNRMPRGKTTVIGLPQGMVHAFFFAADNSPGFALESFEMRGIFVKAPKVQFVAGWSDGRHTAPSRLEPLVNFLKEKQLKATTLLGLGSIPEKEQQEKLREFASDLNRRVEVPGRESVTVGDLLAADAYIQVAESRAKAGR